MHLKFLAVFWNLFKNKVHILLLDMFLKSLNLWTSSLFFSCKETEFVLYTFPYRLDFADCILVMSCNFSVFLFPIMNLEVWLNWDLIFAGGERQWQLCKYWHIFLRRFIMSFVAFANLAAIGGQRADEWFSTRGDLRVPPTPGHLSMSGDSFGCQLTERSGAVGI